ncbi:MMPL family transporter [Aeromicrobium wangtongii]|uniref:MMPL family transporter n=1 Tax=Aeromicrobium wangtongii TaxID=2969247 RepID=A0ABY5MBT2_9ACTN|nr:MMPL family transporter [Aeromicrobium wangtongii]MCD9199793.1 MMPL family transporter [Aeromicrobium wangtongii]UUP14143.1 MMPL family transporter [Aeromicrobium wangtongii]
MTIQLPAPDHTGADKKPKRSPAKTLLPWLVLAAWIGLLVGGFSLAGKLDSVTRDGQADYLPANAQSTKVLQAEAGLPGGENGLLVILYERPGGLDPGDREAVVSGQAELAERLGTDAEVSPEIVQSDDGTSLMYTASLGGEAVAEEAGATADARKALTGHPDGLDVYVTGPTALGADMDEVFDAVDSTLLLATAVVVALLLIVTYRSPLLWLVPLVSVGAAAIASMGVVYALTQMFDFTITSMSSALLIVLVFGAGTDYALLLVARYREELHRHERPIDAMLAALRGAGPAILASAATVVAGLLCLLAADLNSISSLGPVGAAGIGAALAVMLTLFPALLVLLGRRIFWPFVPRVGDEVRASGSRWARLGELVARRRVIGWVAPLVVLGGLALGTVGVNSALPQLEQFARSTPDSVTGAKLIEDRYPDQGGQPLTVMSRPDNSREVLAAVESTSGVASAEIGRAGADWVEISAMPVDAAESAGETATIKDLRENVREVAGEDALVGGSSAEKLDEAETNKSDRNLVMPLILLVVLAILGLLLRAVVAPLVLVATVVVSYFGALGLCNLVFDHVFGFAGMESSVPLIGFLFLVALGVDYNIFLMSRVREEAVRHGTVEGTKRALATTGGVITSAGVVLAATFVVLASLPLVMLVEIGVLVAVGVLIDTLLVRSIVVPALTMSLGSRIWWPSRLWRAEQDRVDDRA